MPAADLVIEYVPYDSVIPHPQNPRIGDVDRIERSLRRHRQYTPLTIQRSTRHIIKGNHTWLGLGRVKVPTIAVVFLDVDDAEALEILIDDNHSSDDGDYDRKLLAELIQSLESLPSTYLPVELDDLLLSLTPQSLDDLARDLGEHDPAAVWPHVRLQVAPATKARFEVWWAGVPGDTDEAKLSGVLDRFDTGKAKRGRAKATA